MSKNTVKATTLAAIPLWLVATLVSMSASAEEHFTIKDGQLERPTGYREWIYVGTPVTPNELNNGKAAFPEHHNVYIDPDSWAHWKNTGQFSRVQPGRNERKLTPENAVFRECHPAHRTLPPE